MIQYAEYIKGRAVHETTIMSADVHRQYGGLKADVFYPIIPFRDEEDMFPVSDVVRLPLKEVMVCDRPGEEPALKKLHIEGDWGYEIISTDGDAA